MEKRVPHFRLVEVLKQMTHVEALNLTLSAQSGIRSLGMSWHEALECIQALTRQDFYKSMTSQVDHRVWQDVYHGHYGSTALYIKISKAGEYFVISFKEQ